MLLQKTVNKDDFHKECLTILNSVLKLTTTEIQVLAEFLKLKSSFELFSEEESNKLTFSSTSRQFVCDKLGISKYNLNNYINVLKKKRMIVEYDKGIYKLNPYIKFDEKEGLKVTFIIKTN